MNELSESLSYIPSTLVAFIIMSELISIALKAPADISSTKKGLPVPAAKITILFLL